MGSGRQGCLTVAGLGSSQSALEEARVHAPAGEAVPRDWGERLTEAHLCGKMQRAAHRTAFTTRPLPLGLQAVSSLGNDPVFRQVQDQTLDELYYQASQREAALLGLRHVGW